MTQRYFQLHISLGGVRPQIRRRVLVPENSTLSDLHQVIQGAFNWWDMHLHEFRIGDRIFTAFDPEYAKEDKAAGREPEEQRRLSDLVRVGQQFVYLYDFGDRWEHRIQVEKIIEMPTGTIPSCVDGARAAPPDDCGGAPGYMELLKMLASGKKKEIERYLNDNCFLEPWDPEHFSLEGTNECIKNTLKETNCPCCALMRKTDRTGKPHTLEAFIVAAKKLGGVRKQRNRKRKGK